MAPKNLKIGDTFTETTADNHILKYKVIGFDGAGRYISEYIGDERKKVEPKVEEDIPLEELPFADVEEEEVVEEKPKVEKKAPAKRKPATKKKTATKKKA